MAEAFIIAAKFTLATKKTVLLLRKLTGLAACAETMLKIAVEEYTTALPAK